MTGDSTSRIHCATPHLVPQICSTPPFCVPGEDLLPCTSDSAQVHIDLRPDCVAQHAVSQSTIDNSANVESPSGDMSFQHHLIASPSSIVAHSIDQSGSSHRTSYFSTVYIPTSFSMVPCGDSLGVYATPSTQSLSAEPMSSSMPEGTWQTNDSRWCQLHTYAVESPVSSWTESCPDDCFGDSNAEDSMLLSPLVNPAQDPSSINSLLSSIRKLAPAYRGSRKRTNTSKLP
ncbi:hypothetical protein J3A83DRAFT_1106256 [Scleroderma citrinum]